MNHRRAIEVLKEARIFCPAVVPGLGGGGYNVFSAMKLLGSGETIEDAMQDARSKGYIPVVRGLPPFREDGKNVIRAGEAVAVAVSRSMATRIANALNQYQPDERGS